MKVALYIRVSTQEQAKEGYSISEQEERLKNYCKAMLWDIYKIYVDPGYSGGDTNRPALQSMITDIENKLIDKVLVYKLDRLSRSQLDTLYLIEKVFLNNNTDFVSMNENFDTGTAFGRAMIGILAVFAQLEREQIKERMAMGKEARAREGKWHGGSTEPIGYDYDGERESLMINEYERIQILEMIELFMNNTPLRRIEKIFDEKGYKHKHGSWDAKTMRRIMRNKLYLGYIKHNDEYYRAEHDALFDEQTFEQINRMLDQRAEQFKLNGIKPGTQTTFLGGLLYCKHCGAKYAKDYTRSRHKDEKNWIYVCYSRNKKMKKMIKDPNCKNKRWKMNELDNLIFDEIKKIAFDSEYLKTLKTKNESTAPEKIRIIENEIKKLDDQISRFMDLYGIGKFTIDQVSKKVDPLNDERNKLQKELETLNAESGHLNDDQTIELVESFVEALEYGDFDDVRAIIENLIYYIELDNDDIYIHWKFA